MIQFTPWPWADQGNKGHGSSIVVGANPTQLVALVYGEDNGALEANARLIAEAPRMLEALKAWEKWYSEDSSEFNRETAREMGSASIARAEQGENRHV